MIEAEDGEPEPIVFADTSFVYPWLFERHPLHPEAKQLEAALGKTRVFTIDEVVTELQHVEAAAAADGDRVRR